MKLLRAGKGGLVFQLSPRGKQLLLEIIALYPLVPASHHRIARPDDIPSAEPQHLLDEALTEQRRENRRQVQAMLDQPDRFRKARSGFEFTLTRAEIEWLLQVFNDVRVGSWLALGEPEPGAEPPPTELNARPLIAMEVSGMFQSVLLAALGVSESPEWAG